MADLYCPRCGEPWDIDELHMMAEVNNVTFSQIRKLFKMDGCAIFNTTHNEDADSDRAEMSAIAMDLMGDDVDGAVSMLEDFEMISALSYDRYDHD